MFVVKNKAEYFVVIRHFSQKALDLADSAAKLFCPHFRSFNKTTDNLWTISPVLPKHSQMNGTNFESPYIRKKFQFYLETLFSLKSHQQVADDYFNHSLIFADFGCSCIGKNGCILFAFINLGQKFVNLISMFIIFVWKLKNRLLY